MGGCCSTCILGICCSSGRRTRGVVCGRRGSSWYQYVVEWAYCGAHAGGRKKPEECGDGEAADECAYDEEPDVDEYCFFVWRDGCVCVDRERRVIVVGVCITLFHSSGW